MWDFISDSENQKTIAWLCGGLAVAVSGLWTAYLTLRPKPKSPPPKPSVAGRDGVTAAGNVSVAGDVNVVQPAQMKPPLLLGALGLAAIGYAVFFAAPGDCLTDSIKSGGDINATTITVTGGSAQVDC